MIELAEEAIGRHALLFSNPPKPGQMILSLPQDKRNVLSTLKAEDIKDVRWPLYQ